MRCFPTFAVLACALAGHRVAISGAEAPLTPVLVELFTSEGCSSCPPADAWIQQLDSSQPIPNAQLIVLSEHVDVWDHDGWKDRFSSHSWTERQLAYVQGLHLSEPHTPQIIVDGGSEVQGNDKARIAEVIQKAAAAPKASVRITSVSIDASSSPILHSRIEVDGAPEIAAADVYAAIALNHAESEVLHGENGGHRLAHVAVLEDLVKIGKVGKGKSLRQDFQRKLKPGSDPSNLRLIVFAQVAGSGQVLGVAMKKSPFQ